MRYDVMEIAQAEPAIFFLDGGAVESQRAHFGPERAIELVLLVDIGGLGRDPIGGETAGRLADHVGGFAQREIERGFHSIPPKYLSNLLNPTKFAGRSEEPTSEIQSIMRISYSVFCLKKN